MHPEDVARVVTDAVRKDRRFRRRNGVTEREWQVLVANAEYRTQERAAEALGMGIQTFKNNMTSAKRRLQASSQLDMYLRLGWLVLPEHPETQVTGDIPDTLLVHGHMVVHVAACSCREPALDTSG